MYGMHVYEYGQERCLSYIYSQERERSVIVVERVFEFIRLMHNFVEDLPRVTKLHGHVAREVCNIATHASCDVINAYTC